MLFFFQRTLGNVFFTLSIDLQEILFDDFGCYYERKKGEFSAPRYFEWVMV